VNGRCAATLEHCVRSGGGLPFLEYADFEVAADKLLADSELRERLVANGRSYAQRVFNWPAIVDRYEALADRVLARAMAHRSPAGMIGGTVG
jgi:glycosyltransferase involved in cell wall biosynthesis